MPSTDLRNYQPVVPPGCEGLVTEEEAARIFADSMDAEEARDRIIALARQRAIEELDRQIIGAPSEARMHASVNAFWLGSADEPAARLQRILDKVNEIKDFHRKESINATLLLQPTPPSKTRGGFGPIVSEEGRFITDEAILIDTEAVGTKTLSALSKAKRLESSLPKVRQGNMSRLWHLATEPARIKPAQVAGYLPTKDQVCLIGDFAPVGLAAERFSWLVKHIQPTSYAVHVPTDPSCYHLVFALFMVNNRPAAIMAPMRDCWLDMDTYLLLVQQRR